MRPEHPLSLKLQHKKEMGALSLDDFPIWLSSKMVALVDDLLEIKRKHRSPLQGAHYLSIEEKWNRMKASAPVENGFGDFQETGVGGSSFDASSVKFTYRNMKVLIFSQFVSFMDILDSVLRQLGFVVVSFDGSTSQDIRSERIQRFEEDPKVEIFLI